MDANEDLAARLERLEAEGDALRGRVAELENELNRLRGELEDFRRDEEWRRVQRGEGLL